MQNIPKVFIGFDKAEKLAAYTLAHSVQRNASGPVEIVFLNRATLPMFTRRRHELDSTEFSISRFLVPYLCGYQGRAIFMDCDCVCLGDVYELDEHAMGQAVHGFPVHCVKRKDYTPRESIKFLGAQQTQYGMKNWTSVMVFNNDRCQRLTLDLLNSDFVGGLFFHQFHWVKPRYNIGDLPPEWNVLVGVDSVPDNPKLLHYTQGGPYFKQYRQCELATIWTDELKHMCHVEDGYIKEALEREVLPRF